MKACIISLGVILILGGLTTAAAILLRPVVTTSPNMPDQPSILSYNHKIYCTVNFGQNPYVTPDTIIGYATYPYPHTTTVCSAMGVSTSDAIGMLNVFDSSQQGNYLRYDFFCDDQIKINEISYKIDIYRNSANFIGTYVIPGVSSSAGLSSQAVQSIVAENPDDYRLAYDVYFDSLNHAKILDQKISTIYHDVEVYSIDDISPTNAVFLHFEGSWFPLIKEHGYSGKSIQTVMREKGLTPYDFNG